MAKERVGWKSWGERISSHDQQLDDLIESFPTGQRKNGLGIKGWIIRRLHWLALSRQQDPIACLLHRSADVGVHSYEDQAEH